MRNEAETIFVTPRKWSAGDAGTEEAKKIVDKIKTKHAETAKFPTSDVSLTHSEQYRLHTGFDAIIFRVILSPTGNKRPSKEQIDKMACVLIEAACNAMEAD